MSVYPKRHNPPVEKIQDSARVYFVNFDADTPLSSDFQTRIVIKLLH